MMKNIIIIFILFTALIFPKQDKECNTFLYDHNAAEIEKLLRSIKDAALSEGKIEVLHQYFEGDTSTLIKIYDNHNILILPSFTEAHPKVVDESLARKRPVIIFEELRNKIQNRYGVFVSERNVSSLSQTIKLIMDDYSNIQENMKKNILPTKKEFIEQMTRILN